MKSSTPRINRLRIAEGVVWHACSTCRLVWPFPHLGGSPDRDWLCHVCVTALLSSHPHFRL